MRIRTAFHPTSFQLRRPLARVCFIELVGLLTPAASLTLVQSADNTESVKQAEADVRTLELGKPIERELAGAQSHAYQITLAVGQYLNVMVEQRGIDVVVTLLGPDGKPIAEFDSEIRKQGQETVSQVAEVEGIYRLIVQSGQKKSLSGRYEIRVIELRHATEKDNALQEARKLNTEFVRLIRASRYDEARPLGERALQIRERELGLGHPDVAASLNNLANLYRFQGDYTKAEPLYQRALAIREKVFGTEHPDVAASFSNLSELYRERGDYVEAKVLQQRALAIIEKTLGPEHHEVAYSLHNLASIYRTLGGYTEAKSLYKRAIAIKENALGTEHRDFAASLNNLANLHRALGEYTEAEPLYQRALAIKENVLGPEHIEVAIPLNNLANLYSDKGDYAKAEPLYQRALAIKEKVLGLTHSSVAISLMNLANLYSDKGEYAKAEPLYQRALSILEKTVGLEHPNVAYTLNSLGSLYRETGDYVKSEPLYQRALAILEKTVGPEHPDVADFLNETASLYRDKGDHAKAEPLYQRALAILEKAVGLEHPNVAASLSSLASLYELKGEVAQAIRVQSRACAVSEHNLALNLAAGSERQKLDYLATLSTQTNQTISFHANSAPDDQRARNLAATIILQRKGRVLDAMSDSFTALRQRFNTQDRDQFDQWKSAAAQLGVIVQAGLQRMSPAEYQERIKTLNERKEELEAEIGRRSVEFSVQIKSVTEDAVRSAIPDDAALVEFAVYRPFNAKYTRRDEQFGSPRYIAYVLRQKGEIQWAELGEAAAIDQLVDDLRKALGDADGKTGVPKVSEKKIKPLARALDEKVMRPVRKLLGDTRRVFISPDGKLNLVPFAALVDENNCYLAERYSINYLTSGRDLLRLQVARESKSRPLVIGAPAYGDRDPQARMYFRPLRTAAEVEGIKRVAPEALALYKKNATEAALKKAQAPRFLHIATHGFFLPNGDSSPANSRSFSLLGLPATRAGAGSDVVVGDIQNPLLLSGLALAGANRLQSGEDDGILTALEVAGLDLWGTKLVVLSACNTGVGEVKNGEGVYGLRRALVLAGAESQVVSLWKVNDSATKDLMVAYYRELTKNVGRAEALRRVQRRMLLDPKRRHPYYWAGFIHSGEWANLNGRR